MTDDHGRDNFVMTGVSTLITEVDKKTFNPKREVVLNVAQDLDRNMVVIVITTVTQGPVETEPNIEQVFTMTLLEWAEFNAFLQNQIKVQMLEKLGLPADASPEETARSLLDGLGDNGGM